MKKQLLLFVMTLLPMVAMAEAQEINGIYYNLIEKAGEAEVTSNPSKYKGNVVIPEKVNYNGKDYDVTSIGESAFYFCQDLTAVEIPNGVKSIGESAFFYCSKMTSISIPASVTSIGTNVFHFCRSLTSITIPQGVKTLGSYVLAGCTALTSVSIPSSVTSIGASAFNGCTGLTSLVISNGVKSLDQSAFDGCKSLTSIIIPNSVTSIGVYAFRECTGLKSIVIGSGANDIKGLAFANCSNIEHVYCLAVNVPKTGADAFEGAYPNYTYLHVPEASVAAYKATAPWSSFKSVEALKDTDPISLKCATPTIKINGGELTFECETEGVTFNAAYSYNSGSGNVTGNKMILSGATNCHVTVYATKEGYQDSDVATADVELQVGKRGDVNMDGVVSITDAVTVVNIILNGDDSTAPALQADPEVMEAE